MSLRNFSRIIFSLILSASYASSLMSSPGILRIEGKVLSNEHGNHNGVITIGSGKQVLELFYDSGAFSLEPGDSVVILYSTHPRTADYAGTIVSITAKQTDRAAPSQVFEANIPSYVKERHRPSLRGWLDSKRGLRPAVDADCCESKDGLAYDVAVHRKNAENSQFYYAYGDFNGDRAEDFAIVLIDPRDRVESRKKIPANWTAALAVFNGPFTQVRRPEFYKENIGTPGGSVLWLRKGELCVGPVESGCSLLSPTNRGYTLQHGP